MKVEEGDVTLVKNLDRRRCDNANMIRLVIEFDQMGFAIHFLESGINTEGTMDEKVVIILSAVTLVERLSILERPNEVRIKAKKLYIWSHPVWKKTTIGMA